MGSGTVNNTAPTTSTTSTTSQAGFGLLNPVEANLQDAASGSHRDGRIRNPVPSKLKGKTDGSKGNFSVLHMDVAGRTEATERDAQAKRTSESTELAAKRAYENGYVSLRRSRFVHVPDETAETPPPKPFIPSVAPQPAPAPGAASASAQSESISTRRSPLNSEETKSEQARLLTLLRSLHPVLVVDQICKALAFFGGIPGAPPPPDGSFPESAEANGSGSLFVGWIAEIFPKLGGNASQSARSPGRQLDSTETFKRRRGRPKGSKATKARKDKGIKKGPTKPSTSSDQPRQAPAVDESWVDVDDDDDDDEDVRAEPSDNVNANVMLLARASAAQPNSQPSIQRETQQQAKGVENTPVRTALPGTSGNGNPTEAASSTKKRGRPKGSKNRPKDGTLVSSEAPITNPQVIQEVQDVHPSYLASVQGSQPTQQTQNPAANSSFTAVNSAAATTTPLKKKTGRPKGSTGKQKPSKTSGVDISGLLPDAGATPSTRTDTYSSTHASSASVTAGNNHTNQGQAYQTSEQAQMNLQTPILTGQAQQAPANSTQKRKRKPAKESNAPLPEANSEAGGQASLTGQANGVGLPIATAMNQSPQMAGSSALSLPPAKRPRKSQEPKASAKKQNEPLPTTNARHQNPDATNMISPTSAPKPSPTPIPAPSSAQVTGATPVPAPGLSTAQISTPISVEPTMTSISSPQHSHFEVQSPTIENYEAQLQAQLEQQTEAESQSQPLPPHGQVNNSRHLMANRLHHHQQQHHLQQRQQQMQQAQQVQQAKQQAQQPSVSQSRSPNPQPQSQPQTKKPQTDSPIIGQQQTRQHPHTQQQYSQYRAANAQYSQQHHPPDQQEHKQQQPPQQPHQQNYSPQPPQQHFATHSQNAPSVTGQSQQYSTTTQQTQQYTPSQQSYTAGQHQYSGGQQQHVGSHQRYQQQLGTSSGGTASYTSHQSPQFGASTASSAGFNAVDSNYRTTSSALNNPSYVPQRSQSATPSATAAYRATNVHNLSHHSSFSANTGAGQHRSTSTSHAVGQNVQGMANVGSFSTGAATDWGNLFDASNLDAAGTQGALGLNNANYNMNPGSVRSQQNTGATFPTNTLTNFDTSGLGGSDRYYGVQRR